MGLNGPILGNAGIMRIAKIELYRLELPYSGGTYVLSEGREYTGFDGSFVRLVTDDGLEGWGESTPFGATYIAAHGAGARAGIAEIAPHLLGLDPRNVDRVNDQMDAALVGHNHAKSAIDLALWDVFGKAVDMPVCALLGGAIDERLPIISSIYASSPEDMRTRVAAHRAAGYLGHSIKIGALDHEGGPKLDADRIRACLADRQPGEVYLADANGGLTVENALRMIALLPDGLDFILEAPCRTWRETRTLRPRCPYPILLDELIQQDQDVIEMISGDVGDGIGLKISKAGGLTHARRQRDICLAAGATMSVQDTVGSTIAFAAIAHLGATVPRRNLRCILDCRDMVSIKTAEFDAPVQNGGILVPKASGLGITVDRDLFGAPLAVWE